MCVCVYIYIYIYIYICVGVCVYIYICVCVCNLISLHFRTAGNSVGLENSSVIRAKRKKMEYINRREI